jgi:Spy/CpxP family protein refolding chaperone
MKKWMLTVTAVLSIGLFAGCTTKGEGAQPVSAQPANQGAGHAAQGHGTGAAQPYAGLQNRPIKALAPERVSDLLAGRGAQYALAAELNHYPGPSHVLESAQALHLTPDQQSQVQALHDSHKAEAKALGQQLVDLETQLDKAFGSGTITESELAKLVSEISTVEAKLRTAHLSTHLKTKALLTPEQIQRYDQLRGYAN